MGDQVVKIPRISDSNVISFFEKIYSLLPDDLKPASVSAKCLGEINFYIISESADENSSGLKTDILEKNLNVIREVNLQVPNTGFSILYRRGGMQHDNPSPLYDDVKITYPDPNSHYNSKLSDTLKLKIFEILNNDFFAVTSENETTLIGALREQSQAAAIGQAVISRLQETGVKFAQDLQNFHIKVQDDLFEYKRKLDHVFSEQKAKLEEEHSEKLSEVSKIKEALEKQKQEIDIREPRHLRRQLRLDLLSEIEHRSEKFSLTKGTVQLRWPIYVLLFFVFGTFLIGSYSYGKGLIGTLAGPINSVSIAILFFKSLAMTFGAVATALYYIKWQNKWFERHADEEFKLKQFQLDIDRASWVIETLQEWVNEKKEPIPERLLESLTKNLFAYDENSHQPVLHPADELASALLGSAASARLKMGDSEIAFDRKDLKNLPKKQSTN